MSKLTDIDKIKIVELYTNGEKIKNIANIFQVTPPAISGIIRRREIKKRPKARKFSLREDIFYSIDTEAKAYWLGFLFGDGSIKNTKNTLILELSNIDSEHIIKFKNFLESNYNLYYTKKKCCGIAVHSKILCGDLIKLGCVPNKTYLKIKTPNIDYNLLVHFYRGLLDADGWITHHKTKNKKNQHEFGFSSYHQDILLEIKEFISKFIKKDVGYIITRIRNNQQCSQLIIGGNKNFVKIGKLFYNQENICLDRKKQKYIQFIKEI